MEENLDLYNTEFDKETRFYSVHDYLNQEVIVIREDQLIELIKKYCEINRKKLL